MRSDDDDDDEPFHHYLGRSIDLLVSESSLCVFVYDDGNDDGMCGLKTCKQVCALHSRLYCHSDDDDDGGRGRGDANMCACACVDRHIC